MNRQLRTSAPGTHGRRLSLLLLSVGGLVFATCGSDPVTQASARDKAAQELCDRSARCGEIGPSGMYTSVEDCLTKQKATVQSGWPEAECAHINATQLDVCLSAIKSLECDNALGAADVLVNKCPKAKICTP